MSAKGNCLFLGTSDDKEYTPYLKGMFNGRNTFIITRPVSLLTDIEIFCQRNNITAVVSTNTDILQKLLEKQGHPGNSPKLSNYQGSVFEHAGIEFVFIAPLRQLFTVSYGKFIASRFISKVAAPDSWPESTTFQWSCPTDGELSHVYEDLSRAFAIATDIETFKVNLAIRCIGYTGIFISDRGDISTRSYVIPLDSEYRLAWVRKINALPVDKIFQKGKYDNSYLLRYNAPVSHWLWDCANLSHSYYSELPKDLAFLNAFWLRKVVYWKDLAETRDLKEYYRYNALDTWATANVWIQQMLQLPEWARHNYTLEFPLVFPCLYSELTGIPRDYERLEAARTKLKADVEKELTSLRKALGNPTFNPNSPPQVKKLLEILGCEDIPSTEEKDLKKAAYRHPLNNWFIDKILKIRGWRKVLTTYLRTDEDADKNGEGGSKDFNGFVLYNLNPDDTDTGRLASKEHAFWCGFNIQNQPRGEPGEPSYVKSTLRAPEGFYLGEADLEQAEARDTGYISGDTALIAAVSGTRDFHAHNASAFFGTPYDLIFDDKTRKTLNKKLRDLSKRTNHGANYNMGPDVLVDTMGVDKVWEAKKLLNLPYDTLSEIAEHLLTVFHLTYSGLRGPIKIRNENVRLFLRLPKSTNRLFAPDTYYAAIANEIARTRKLVSRAFHHTEYNTRHYLPDAYIERGDWTRYCFGNPTENKLDLNSYVAHPSQSLNARTLNEAYLRVFYEVALPNPETFRLHAQIHDSILFSYHASRGLMHPSQVRECMEIPVSVKDVHGITRKFTVPASLKIGKGDKRAVYWDETE